MSISQARKRPHECKPILEIYNPAVVLACQVNQADIVKGALTVPYDGITTGSFSNVKAEMTMYVGTSTGANDVGRVRVRSADASNIYVGYGDHINWQDNLYLTIVNFWEPWGVFPLNTTDLNQETLAVYKDVNVTYTDQNTNFDPVVCMGPHRACAPGEYLEWSSSGTYSPTGSELSSYSWTFEGGHTGTSTAAHPGLVRYDSPGSYTTALTVNDAAGKSYTSYRHVVVGDGIRRWGLSSFEGSRDQGGYSVRIWLRERVTQLKDGALVIIRSDDVYGGETVRNIRFVGYVRDHSIMYNSIESRVEFEAQSIMMCLEGRETFGDAIDDIEAPYGWALFPSQTLTVDRALVHYLRWNTSVLRTCDFSPTGDTAKTHYGDFVRGPISSTIQSALEAKLFAKAVCNREGKIFCEIDINSMPTGTRSIPTTMLLDRQDWRDEPSIKVATPMTSYLELGGAYWAPITLPLSDINVEKAGAVLSAAPGLWPSTLGTQQTSTGLVINTSPVSGQDTINVLSGNRFASLNSKYPEVVVPMAGNYLMHDIAPQTRTLITVSADDTVSNVAFTNKPFIPQRVSYKYDPRTKSMFEDVTYKEETYGFPGTTKLIPTDTTDDDPIPPDPPTNPLPPLVVPPGLQGTDLVYAADQSYFKRTRTFTATSPSWENATGAITGTIRDFALDPFSPRDKACVVTTTGVWFTESLNNPTPTWIKRSSGPSGATLVKAECVRYTIKQTGVVYVLALCTVGGTPYVYSGRTSDNGSTWTWTQVGQTTATTDVHDLEVSQWNASVALCSCGAGKLYKTTNGGGSWSNIYTVPSATVPIANIELPYESNSLDQTIYMGGYVNYETVMGDLLNQEFATDVSSWLLDADVESLVWQEAHRARVSIISGRLGGDHPCYQNIYLGAGTYSVKTYMKGIAALNFTRGPWFGNQGSGDSDNDVWNARTYTRTVTAGTYQIGFYQAGGVGTKTADIQYCRLVEVIATPELGVVKSTDGGLTFLNIRPSDNHGAIGWRGLHAMYPLSKDLITAFVGSVGTSLDLVVSSNGGTSWSEKRASVNTPIALGRWPYHTHGLYFGEATHWYYSIDDGVTLLDKTGNFGTLSTPRNIVPVWIGG